MQFRSIYPQIDHQHSSFSLSCYVALRFDSRCEMRAHTTSNAHSNAHAMMLIYNLFGSFFRIIRNSFSCTLSKNLFFDAVAFHAFLEQCCQLIYHRICRSNFGLLFLYFVVFFYISDRLMRATRFMRMAWLSRCRYIYAIA